VIYSFLYCWTDHFTQKLYIGSHKGTIDDGYVCSSKYMLEEYRKRPQDFSRQIIAQGCFEDIRKLETTILQSVNARLNEEFYNRSNADGKWYRVGPRSKESLIKQSRSTKGRTISAKQKQQILDSWKDPVIRAKRSKKKSTVENMITAAYRRHNDPVYKEKHREAIRKSWIARKAKRSA
jgi:hypothetical protein